MAMDYGYVSTHIWSSHGITGAIGCVCVVGRRHIWKQQKQRLLRASKIQSSFVMLLLVWPRRPNRYYACHHCRWTTVSLLTSSMQSYVCKTATSVQVMSFDGKDYVRRKHQIDWKTGSTWFYEMVESESVLVMVLKLRSCLPLSKEILKWLWAPVLLCLCFRLHSV